METMNIPARLAYSIEEVARCAGVSADLIRREIRKGEIRTVRLGDRVLVPKAELFRICGTSGTA